MKENGKGMRYIVLKGVLDLVAGRLSNDRRGGTSTVGNGRDDMKKCVCIAIALLVAGCSEGIEQVVSPQQEQIRQACRNLSNDHRGSLRAVSRLGASHSYTFEVTGGMGRSMAYLAECGTEAVPCLIEVVDAATAAQGEQAESDPYSGPLAAQILAQSGDRRAVLPLVRLGLKQPTVRFRHFVAYFIAQLGDPDAIAGLIELYPYEDRDTQNFIARVLSMSDSPFVAPALMEWALPSGNQFVIQGLRRRRVDEAEPIFRQVLTNGRAWPAHDSAIIGLVNLGKRDLDIEAILNTHASSSQRYARERRERWNRYLLAESFQMPPLCDMQFEGANEELRAYIAQRLETKRAEQESAISSQGLELELRLASHELVVGDTLDYSLIIKNNGDDTVKVMRSRDGSDVGWVYPSIRAEVWGPDHRILNLSGGRCGNVNGLSPDDISQLRPGEEFDVHGEGSFGNHVLDYMLRFSVPGTYRIRVTYSTLDEDVSGDGLEMGEDVSGSGARPSGVIPVKLRTQMVEVEVSPSSEEE